MAKKEDNINTNSAADETIDDAAVTPEEVGVDEAASDEASDEASDGSEDVKEPAKASENAEEAAEEEPKKEEKKFKKKKKDKKDEKIAELEDRVMRQMAEFQNFRNRTEKEKASMYEMGAKSVIEKILPVIDNFERGLQSVPDDEQDTAIATGMQMIYKQLLTELEAIGVKPIEAVGQEFNPDLHNAVMQTESDEYESGIVAQELQKGYTYRDNVVRHSMVAVVS